MNLDPEGMVHEAPLRDQLVLRARSLAIRDAEGTGAPKQRKHARLATPQDLLARWKAVHAELRERAKRIENRPPACEWLLDNAYVIRQVLQALEDGLSKAMLRRLPKGSSGVLRVETLAREYLIASKYEFKEEELVDLLSTYQELAELSIAETWAVPLLLRHCCVEYLLGVARRISDEFEVRITIRNAAELEAVHAFALWADPVLDATKSLVGTRNLSRRLISILQDELRRLGPAGVESIDWLHLHAWAQDDGTGPNEAGEHADATWEAERVGKAVCTLRLMDQIDWRRWFERVSITHHILLNDPAGLYGACDFATRDRYRQEVEHLARFAGISEGKVARIVLSLTLTSPEVPANHCGYYLVGAGNAALVEQLRIGRVVRALSFDSWSPEALLRIYLGSVFVITLAVMLFFLGPAQHLSNLGAFLFALLLVFPASDIAVSVVQSILSSIQRPRSIPKLDLEKGIPDELRSAVVVHAVFADVESVRKTFDSLEVRYVGNADRNLVYVVLSDLPDADSETTPQDAEIIETARSRVDALRAQYGHDRFLVLFRARAFNPSEGRFMAWERKRGKLDEFNRAILGERGTSFRITEPERALLRGIHFVITLDNDSQLPPNSARKLVGALAHPLNRPIVDPKRRMVVSGYGILQPRVSTTLAATTASKFASLYGGDGGLDPYTRLVSDVYQDLLGEGSFVGKGIYDVRAFHEVLSGRVPENTLLSHDLFEGSFARCGFLSDVELFDEVPARYHVYMRRLHRWVRGDWQLLPFLGGKLPTPTGATEENPLSTFSKWRFLDNLRRSLVAPALVALLLICLATKVVNPWWWLVGSFFTLAIPVYLNLSHALMLPPLGLPVVAHARAIRFELWRKLKQSLAEFAFLPNLAWSMSDAIARTVWRVSISKRHLLEWESAYYADRRLQPTLGAFLREMRGGLLLTVICLVTAAVFNPQAAVALAPLWILWLASPFIALSLSRPIEHRSTPPTDENREYLLKVAQETWQFFADYLNPENNFLMPDNLQVGPAGGVARRTSPTNIGLSILSVMAAEKLGFIDLGEAVKRITQILRTVMTLERYRGHLFNWYSTETLTPLRPRYISFVDSGNFVGHLLTIRTYLEHAHLRPGGEMTEEPLTIVNRLIREADFRWMFDDRRLLFRIGYSVENDQLDTNVYDLLASEARLGSYVAIALGQAPPDHWFNLGRPLVTLEGGPVLVSWSGSMFEYLMPQLVMQAYDDSLIETSNRGVVRAHMRYGAERRTPWGMSESAHRETDADGVYQYRAFGLQRAGLKRGLQQDLVVAPYATMLAVGTVPDAEIVANLKLLDEKGARAQYGYYESIDYAGGDNPKGEIISSFFAHHQGMSLVAIANRLTEKSFVELFHANQEVRAAELLLQERVPRTYVSFEQREEEDFIGRDRPEDVRPELRKHHRVDIKNPRVSVLSNGRYTVTIDAQGCGSSEYNGVQLTRWREDYDDRRWGTFIYLMDADQGTVWSPTFLPVGSTPPDHDAFFDGRRVVFSARAHGIGATLDITVPDGVDAELRVLRLRSISPTKRRLRVMSYGEVALNTSRADSSHPAFSKMFVNSGLMDDMPGVYFVRRPMKEGETTPVFIHALTCGNGEDTRTAASRAEILGRGGSIYRMAGWSGFSANTEKNSEFTLDPAFGVMTSIDLEPEEERILVFCSVAAPTLDEAFETVRGMRSLEHVMSVVSHTVHEPEQAPGLEPWLPSEIDLAQRLARAIVQDVSELRAKPDVLLKNRSGQEGLWKIGISGDLPIVTAEVSGETISHEVSKILRAYDYLRRHGVRFELVLLTRDGDGYYRGSRTAITRVIQTLGLTDYMEEAGGIFIRQQENLSDEDRVVLESFARAILTEEVIEGPSLEEEAAAIQPPSSAALHRTPVMIGAGSQLANDDRHQLSWRWDAERRAIGMALRDGELCPLPWSNVLADTEFGTLVTDAGGGYTWCGNSREFRLTPWTNDPLTDPAGEMLYLRERGSNSYQTLLGLPADTSCRSRDVFHEPGRSVFELSWGDLGVSTSIEVMKGGVKVLRVAVRNLGSRQRNLDLLFHVDWSLGVERQKSYRFVQTSFDEELDCLIARTPAAAEFSHLHAFVGCSRRVHGFSGNRNSFVGPLGTLRAPSLLADSAEAGELKLLDGVVGAGHIPCGTLSTSVDLGAHESTEVVFFLGAASGRDGIIDLVGRLRSGLADGSLPTVKKEFDELSARLRVKTPDPEFDAMVNVWLPYQTLHARLRGRTGFYQSGGAFGFRDQLQDAGALVHLDPAYPRRQIILHASRQFVEGDVQHWWHPPRGRGVRSRFADDLLWLPYQTIEYLKATGDVSVLDEEAPFLEGRLLADGEMEAYFEPSVSSQTGNILDHCLRAIERACRFGTHGLPLMGGGDWNDGMNKVGERGHGESVWLGWFLGYILREFAGILELKGDEERAGEYRTRVERLRQALEENAWDGAWYRRAFFDDGQMLGSAQCEEASIDSIAQSWSVISGLGDRDRATQALGEVRARLVSEEDSLIKLLTPPFRKGEPNPGYIASYPPGIRENGAQYTHAATWVIAALARLGDGSGAYDMFRLINPMHICATPQGLKRYRGEPYVMCGDVYSEGAHHGQAGWTWYTGASGWMYRIAIEELLGVRRQGHTVEVRPVLPPHWDGFEMEWQTDGKKITIRGTRDQAPRAITFDIRELPPESVHTVMIGEATVAAGSTTLHERNGAGNGARLDDLSDS